MPVLCCCIVIQNVLIVHWKQGKHCYFVTLIHCCLCFSLCFVSLLFTNYEILPNMNLLYWLFTNKYSTFESWYGRFIRITELFMWDTCFFICECLWWLAASSPARATFSCCLNGTYCNVSVEYHSVRAYGVGCSHTQQLAHKPWGMASIRTATEFFFFFLFETCKGHWWLSG